MASNWSIVLGDGITVDLSAYCEVIVGAEGIGMPPMKNILTPYASRPGASYGGTIAQPRVFTIVCRAFGSNLRDLHRLRALLVTAFKPDRAAVQAPVEIHYRGAGTELSIGALYDGGLEMATVQGRSEALALRFVCPDPFWQTRTTSSQALAVANSLTAHYIAARRSGVWGQPGVDGTGPVYAIATAPVAVPSSGTTISIGGTFLDWGGAGAADYYAEWNPTTLTWDSPITPDGTIACFATGPDGRLYMGGVFTHIGVPAFSRIASYGMSMGAMTVAALGAGADDAVLALCFGPDGTLYAGGAFHNIGGVACNHVAKWDGANWTALGAGTDDDVTALAAGPDGAIYVGGQFDHAGAVHTHSIAKWYGGAWVTMQGTTLCKDPGISLEPVYCITVGPDGTVYAGGHFWGNITNCNFIARWNGVIWSPMQSGLDADCSAMAFDANGVLWAGQAAYAGFSATPALSRWNGWAWSVAFAKAGAGGEIYHAIHHTPAGDIWVGMHTTPTAYCGALTTCTNLGTAEAWPVITILGPGTLLAIRNETTSAELLFNFTILPLETVTIDLRPTAKSITSTWRGNSVSYMLAGSDLSGFSLAAAPRAIAGANIITVFMTGTTGATTATAVWYDRHWAADGVAT